MSDYKIISDHAVLRLSDNASIPFDPRNVDYRAYLEWMAAGNTPLPADVPAVVVPLTVTNAQARAVMRQTFPPALNGLSLFTAVDNALRSAKQNTAGLPDNNPDKITADIHWNFWEQANEFCRTGPLVQSLASQFGMSAADLDALFTTAAGVSA